MKTASLETPTRSYGRKAAKPPSVGVILILFLISTLLMGVRSSAVWQVKLTSGHGDQFPSERANHEGADAGSEVHVQHTSVVSIGSVSAIQEVGRPTHYIALINTGDVFVTATLAPRGTDPALIRWVGGTQGSSNQQRLVSTALADTFQIAATIPGQLPVVLTIHVLDATAPPYDADAPAWPVDGGAQPANCPKGCFGQTFMDIGLDGIVRPSYAVLPYFSADRWVFRLNWIQHVYRWFVQPSGFRIALPEEDSPVFPLIPGMNLAQSLSEAKRDLDTHTLIGPTNPSGRPRGPDRLYYWVESIARNHEAAHIYNFYTNWWQPAMDLFERVDVEGGGVFVAFDCTDSATTTGSAAVASKTSDWDAQVTRRHTTAYDQHQPTAEAYAHMITNPQYEPMVAALKQWTTRHSERRSSRETKAAARTVQSHAR